MIALILAFAMIRLKNSSQINYKNYLDAQRKMAKAKKLVEKTQFMD
jgi:hypothetical protein